MRYLLFFLELFFSACVEVKKSYFSFCRVDAKFSFYVNGSLGLFLLQLLLVFLRCLCRSINLALIINIKLIFINYKWLFFF